MYSAKNEEMKTKRKKGQLKRSVVLTLCVAVAFSVMPATGSLFGVYDNVGAKAADEQPHQHNLSFIEEKDYDCENDEPGNIEYWYCEECNKCFSDHAGRYEIDWSRTVILPKHVFDPWQKLDEDMHIRTCENCGETQTEEHIWKKTAVRNSKNIFTCDMCSATEEYMTDETIDSVEFNIDQPKCGEYVADQAGSYTNGPRVSVSDVANYSISKNEDCFWCDDKGAVHTGRLTGGHKYYASVLLSSGSGYTFARSLRAVGSINKWQYDGKVKVNGNEVVPRLSLCFEKYQAVSMVVPVTVEHSWDNGKVTQEPTTKAAGVKTFTCTGCGETRTESIPKREANRKAVDGTSYGKGADLKVMETAMLELKSENDPAGTTLSPLLLKAIKEKKNSISLAWKKPENTAKFIVYGTKCSKKNKMKKLAETITTKMTVKNITRTLSKGTYYKFMVAAIDANDEVIATSKMIHAATKGNNKACNISKLYVKVKVKKKKKAVSKLKVRSGSGRTLIVTGKKPKNGKVVRHAKVRFESSDPSVATVDGSGKVTGVKPGSCTVCVYAQNGMAKVLPLTII